MISVRTRVRQRVCSHEYEVLWAEVGGEMRTLRCRRCGRTREGDVDVSRPDAGE